MTYQSHLYLQFAPLISQYVKITPCKFQLYNEHLYVLLYFIICINTPLLALNPQNPQIRNPNVKQAAMDSDLISSIKIDELDTLYSDFVKPFKCVLDANLFAQESGFNTGMVQSFFQDNNTEYYMTQCLRTKFEIYNNMPINQLPSIEIPEIRDLRCTHERNVFKTNCIKELIGDYNEGRYVVVTADRQLFDELNDGNSLKVIALLYKNGDLYMREPSRNARSIFHLILRDDYIRLMIRANLLKLKEEDTCVGGDSMFAALSCVLKSLVPLNVDLRQMIAAQIRFKIRMYLHLFKEDVDALLSYVEDLSSKETWGDSIALQAAADLVLLIKK